MSRNQFEIEFLDDIPNFDAMGKQDNTVVVQDDLLSEASQSSQHSSLFTREKFKIFCNISITNIFHQGKHSKDMQLNIGYIIMLKKPVTSLK